MFFLISAKVGQKRARRCGKCTGCTASDCQKCTFCQDMIKYGGSGKKKKCCIQRQCVGIGTCTGRSCLFTCSTNWGQGLYLDWLPTYSKATSRASCT